MKYLNGSFERKPISIIAIAGTGLQLSVTLRSARAAAQFKICDSNGVAIIIN